ncbi:helix-turn-helix domain-containing protein [Methylobacterium sp. WL103]|uniref:helix-turn-helix domain-containing protein n=1 Tax=Methylobacterium sp. WL103 TaxID=2603891 RepID=UPI001FEEC6A8|nr:helix-turn-helix domain-containing protein [Methylobacterium sp. WL103]
MMTHDRIGREELPLTHEFLAIMLGVHRLGAKTATQMLEGTGMILAKRAHIIVLDREKLKGLAGSNSGLAEMEYERLMAIA